MSRTAYIALASVAVAIILSFILFHFHNYRDPWEALGLGIDATFFAFVQLLIGFVVKPTWPATGKGLILGAGLIFLIGFGVCTVLVNSH